MAESVPDASLEANVIELWKKYEDVAMHFNDLIMRWRLQAIGGLAGLVTLAGFVVGDAATLSVRYRAMLILSGVLTFAWVGVGLIDLFYYRRLLQGAVKALLAIERDNPRITLSTTIENEAASASTITPWVFYVCGLIPLLVIMGRAIVQLYGLPVDAGAVSD
jgi:hypothetical protein